MQSSERRRWRKDGKIGSLDKKKGGGLCPLGNNESVFLQKSYCMYPAPIQSIDNPIHILFVHFLNPHLWREMENTLGETITIHAFFPDERHAHDSALILSGTRIH